MARRVVTATVHQIAAARNAGARASTGEMLVFVDADTIITPRILRAAVEAMRGGAVGGGASAHFEPSTPPWAHRAIALAAWILRRAGWAAGCFFFARREPFERVGGFDERYFASRGDSHQPGAEAARTVRHPQGQRADLGAQGRALFDAAQPLADDGLDAAGRAEAPQRTRVLVYTSEHFRKERVMRLLPIVWMMAARSRCRRSRASNRRRRATGRPRRWSRVSTAWASGSRDRTASPKGATRRTTAWRSGPTTSCRPSTRGWRSSRRRGRSSTTTGKPIYGAVPTNTVFAGLGGPCEARNNGDAVVRYDQLADRWLITMPIFSRIPLSEAGRAAAARPAGASGATRATGTGVRSGPRGRRCRANPPPPPAPPAGQGRGRGQQAGQPASATSAAAAEHLRDVLRDQRRSRSDRGRTIATRSIGRCFPTIRVRRCGSTATTTRPAPATTASRKPSRRRSTPASSIARGC